MLKQDFEDQRAAVLDITTIRSLKHEPFFFVGAYMYLTYSTIHVHAHGEYIVC